VKPKDDDYWDELLQQIDMDYIPLEYMSSVVVKFTDGKEWEIEVQKGKNSELDIEKTLDDFFKEYEDTIDTVDFRLNLKKLQRDVAKRTHRFLKLNK
jgi:hypothetical protein